METLFFSMISLAETMIANPEALAPQLRSLSGIKDIDIVTFPSGKELWIVLKVPLDIEKLRTASQNVGYTVTKVGSLLSKLPRSLAEMVWDGTTHVVIKKPQPRWKPNFGADPAAIASIMRNLVTGEEIFHVKNDDGLKVLQEYLKS